jgi:hypothetical protein
VAQLQIVLTLSLTGSGVAIATLTTASWFRTLDFGTTAFKRVQHH